MNKSKERETAADGNGGVSKRKRWLKRLIWLLILVPVSWYAVPRLVVTFRFTGQAHVPDVDQYFYYFGSTLPGKESELSSIHQGLAHNYGDPALFLRDVWLTRTIGIHGYRFKAGSWQPSPAFQGVVEDVLLDRNSYQPYGGPKLCGGFRANFVARFEEKYRSADVLVCLGCHEVVAFDSDGRNRIIELTQDAWQQLFDAWTLETGKDLWD